MERYDYRDSMRGDVRNAIECDYMALFNVKSAGDFDFDCVCETLHDELWANDSVTGNGSGSYTLSTWRAEENLCHNLELLADAMDEFGLSENLLAKGAEWCDVTIRCYLLAEIIQEVVEEIAKEERLM